MGCGTTRNPYSIRLCWISGGQLIIICIFLASMPRNYPWEMQLPHQYGWISSHHLSHPPAVFIQFRHGASHLRLCNIINFSCFQKAIKNPQQTKSSNLFWAWGISKLFTNSYALKPLLGILLKEKKLDFINVALMFPQALRRNASGFFHRRESALG